MVLETIIIAAIRRAYGEREGTRTPIGGFGDRSPVQLDDSPENLRQRPIHINEGQDQGVPWLSRSQLPLGLRCTMTYGESNPVFLAASWETLYH